MPLMSFESSSATFPSARRFRISSFTSESGWYSTGFLGAAAALEASAAAAGGAAAGEFVAGGPPGFSAGCAGFAAASLFAAGASLEFSAVLSAFASVFSDSWANAVRRKTLFVGLVCEEDFFSFEDLSSVVPSLAAGGACFFSGASVFFSAGSRDFFSASVDLALDALSLASVLVAGASAFGASFFDSLSSESPAFNLGNRSLCS